MDLENVFVYGDNTQEAVLSCSLCRQNIYFEASREYPTLQDAVEAAQAHQCAR